MAFGQDSDTPNHDEVIIRAASDDDNTAARLLQWSVGWKDAPETHRRWPSLGAEWVANHYFQEFVAEVDGVVAARVGLEAYCPPFAEMVNLCVRPDYRRHGLGGKLTRAVQKEAARLGFSMLFLQTEVDNSAAHRLYSSQDWVPTAYGKMLRMVKLLDYPLLSSFLRLHPLYQYHCKPDNDRERVWNMEWHGYVKQDYLRLRLESGASQSDSAGMAPAISGCDWCAKNGSRNLSFRLEREQILDIEPGNHIEIEISAKNDGAETECGVFQAVLPPGVVITSPQTNLTRTFLWSLEPGECLHQRFVVLIEPDFDAHALWYLNYGSVPVSVEAYWEGHRALITTSLPMAVPPPL